MGQQATFTDASRVFVLSVRYREANHALPGQMETSQQLIGYPCSCRSTRGYSVQIERSGTIRDDGKSSNLSENWCGAGHRTRRACR
jgi:hypothetical protein